MPLGQKLKEEIAFLERPHFGGFWGVGGEEGAKLIKKTLPKKYHFLWYNQP